MSQRPRAPTRGVSPAGASKVNKGASASPTRAAVSRGAAVRGPSASGAQQSKTRLADKSRSYWLHHRASLSSSVSRLLSTPLQTLMTSLVVAIALALPATLLLALSNFQQLGDSWDANPKLSVYIKIRARDNAIETLVKSLERRADVARVEYITAAQALLDFQQHSGFGDTLSSLDANPLPATLVVSPKAASMDPASLQKLARAIEEEGIVEEVVYDMDWVRRLRELMHLGQTIVLALASLLGLGVLLAIGNTVRLAIENRREEILVSKLVGGTNAFVRRPFLYTGGCYGIFGGALAAVIVVVAYWAISGSVARLAQLYQSDFDLAGLGFGGVLLLLGLGALLGWLGAWLAVARQLSKIEPS